MKTSGSGPRRVPQLKIPLQAACFSRSTLYKPSLKPPEVWGPVGRQTLTPEKVDMETEHGPDWKTTFFYKPVFRFHVNLPECNRSSSYSIVTYKVCLMKPWRGVATPKLEDQAQAAEHPATNGTLAHQTFTVD